ncbi:hypothetical protein B0J14DRAFT_578119 [Halenospora varia]|nr:hypothetical protein B0J14DRAFT_578119 [Halenospora varia]
MKSSKCLFSASTALHRVFIAPIELSNPQFATRASINSTASPRWQQSKLRCLEQRRGYAGPMPHTRAAGTNPRKSRLPRNEEIAAIARTIVLVNGSGKLENPRATRLVLAGLDPKTEVLLMVSEASADKPAICKIQNKQELYRREKEARKGKGKVPSQTTKTIELNWAIEQGDLAHRMDRLREFLGKGFKVEILLAKKRKGRVATPEEGTALVNKIKEIITEGGWKESKAQEGELGKQVTIFAEGKVVKAE